MRGQKRKTSAVPPCLTLSVHSARTIYVGFVNAVLLRLTYTAQPKLYFQFALGSPFIPFSLSAHTDRRLSERFFRNYYSSSMVYYIELYHSQIPLSRGLMKKTFKIAIITHIRAKGCDLIVTYYL